MDEDELRKPGPVILLGEDLSTMSVGDIDDRIADLEAEIARLKEERGSKTNSMSAAEAFFKK